MNLECFCRSFNLTKMYLNETNMSKHCTHYLNNNNHGALARTTELTLSCKITNFK